MKEQYEALEIKIILFESSDVITASDNKDIDTPELDN